MARTFEKDSGEKGGDGDGGDGDKNRKRDGREPPGVINGTSGYSGPDTDTEELESLPTPEEPSEDIREEADEARHLYLDFLRAEIHRRGISEPTCLTSQEDNVDADRVIDWTRAGRELRQLADVFSRSKERESVRRRAQGITLESLDYEHFFLLLQELFQGEGVTRERILVLFFFCADLAIESLKKGFHKSFHTLIEWSLKYIATRVARWVHDHGGWGSVLRSSLTVAYQFTACCAFVAVAVACAVYIRRSPR